MDLERVHASLQAAHLCLEQRLFDSAVSRAYFAIFQAAICALESRGIRCEEWTHKGIHSCEGSCFMARKRNIPSRRELLDHQLSQLAAFIKAESPQARVDISLAQYEDEDAHVSIYPPPAMDPEEIRCLERALGERCNDILIETGAFIIGAVCD